MLPLTRNWNNGEGFKPIGNNSTQVHWFTTTGNGYHIIDRLYINRPGEDYIGLFGMVQTMSD